MNREQDTHVAVTDDQKSPLCNLCITRRVECKCHISIWAGHPVLTFSPLTDACFRVCAHVCVCVCKSQAVSQAAKDVPGIHTHTNRGWFSHFLGSARQLKIDPYHSLNRCGVAGSVVYLYNAVLVPKNAHKAPRYNQWNVNKNSTLLLENCFWFWIQRLILFNISQM